MRVSFVLEAISLYKGLKLLLLLTTPRTRLWRRGPVKYRLS
jgi:hypothetical protein